jgi:hypothetical protein
MSAMAAKSSLYFDAANGFGDWRILVSSKAENHLRHARKQDGNTFMVVIKKIRFVHSSFVVVRITLFQLVEICRKVTSLQTIKNV